MLTHFNVAHAPKARPNPVRQPAGAAKVGWTTRDCAHTRANMTAATFPVSSDATPNVVDVLRDLSEVQSLLKCVRREAVQAALFRLAQTLLQVSLDGAHALILPACVPAASVLDNCRHEPVHALSQEIHRASMWLHCSLCPHSEPYESRDRGYVCARLLPIFETSV